MNSTRTFKKSIFAFLFLFSFSINSIFAAGNHQSGQNHSQHVPLCGTYSVGPTGTYASIGAAITDIQANGIGCSIILELQAAYLSSVETFPIVIPDLLADASNTITLQPEVGATGLKIAGNASSIIHFNGSGFFTIDGRPGGAGTNIELSIVDTMTTGNTLLFDNDSHDNIVSYLNILGATTGSTTNAVIQFGISATIAGNSNNTICFSNISKSSSAPQVLIYSANSFPGAFNTNNTITTNNLYDWFTPTASNIAINLGAGNTGWSIFTNSFYQTSNQTYTASATHSAININSTAGNGYIISGNYIGGSAPMCGGTPWTIDGNSGPRFNGIAMNVDTVTFSEVQGNTVQNLSMSTSAGGGGGSTVFNGILITGGNVNVGTTSANTIGSDGINGSISLICSAGGASPTAFGINTSSTHSVNIYNNYVGGITSDGALATNVTSVIGIQASAGTVDITSNTVGSTTTSNSIQNAPGTGAQNNQVAGIYVTTVNTANIEGNAVMNLLNRYQGTSIGIVRGIGMTGGVSTAKFNIIRFLVNVSPQVSTNGSASVLGISNTSTQPGQSIIGNDVQALTNGSLSAAVYVTGIYFNGSAASKNWIYWNYIAAIGAPSDTLGAVINGIHINGGTSDIYNNMISLGTDPTGIDFVTSNQYNGILKTTTASNNFFYNTVGLWGAAITNGSANSFGFRRSASGTDSIVNNIFANFRSNSTATGTNYAIGLNDTSGAFSDHNDLFGNGTGFSTGLLSAAVASNLSSWTALTLRDANSVAVDPGFNSNLDLHIAASVTPSSLESRGIDIPTITDDFDGNVRPGPAGSVNGGASAPDIGCDEFDGIPITVDMGAFALSSPLSIGCHSATETVTVSIKNFSSLMIDFAVDSVTVSASVSGVSPATFTPVIVNTGTLAPGATLDVVISNSYDMSLSGTYVFTAYTTTSGDGSAANDTMPVTTISVSGGTTSPSFTSVCDGVPITFTVTGQTTGGTLQWQTSVDQLTWFDIPGDTLSTEVITPIADMYIRSVSCGTYFSNIDTVHVTSVTPPITTGDTRCGNGQVTLTATGGNPILWFDSLSGGSVLDTGSVFTPNVTGTTTFYAAASGNQSAPDSLFTLISGPNNSGGTMFTLTALNNVTVTGFDDQAGTGTNDWAVYYRPDDIITIPGSNTSNSGWILAGTAAGVVSAGAGALTSIPLNLAITIPAGRTYSFYVLVTSGPNVIYSVGTGLGDVNYSNADLQMHDGYAGTTFNCGTAQRIFNGTVHYYTSCISARIPAIANVTPPTGIVAGATANSICEGDSVVLSVTSTNLNYTYAWSPTTDLRDSTGLSVWAVPGTGTSTYYVNATDPVSGCAALDSVTITVTPKPVISISVNNDSICAGDTLQLSVNLPSLFTIGTLTQSNQGTQYPCPYGNSSWGARNQMLIRASELAASGFQSGYINSLAFDVTTQGGVPVLDNFTIKLGLTLQAALTPTFETSPLTVVFSDTGFVPVIGWNTHNFIAPFYWDGVSNLLIETCFEDSTASTNCHLRWTNTGFNSSISYHANATGNCSNPTGTTSTQRTTMRLGIQNHYMVQWFSTEGIDNDTLQSTFSIPTQNAMYVVRVTDSITGCSAMDSIQTWSIPYPDVVASVGGDTASCGSMITLDAQNPGSTYLWSDNSTNQTLDVTATGSFTVVVTNAPGCSVRDSMHVTINTPPVVTLVLPWDQLCTTFGIQTISGESPSGGVFSGVGVSGNTIDPNLTIPGDSVAITYTYTDPSTNCSSSATDSALVVVCFGIPTLEDQGVPSLYPNPGTGMFVLNALNISGTFVANVTTPDGRLITSQQLQGNSKHELNLASYADGIYYLSINTADAKYILKIVKQN